MPEGPEIRRAADKIASVLIDQKIDHIEFAFQHLKKYQRKLAHQTVTAVETRGKAILTHFDNNRVIYSHNQLYGRWVICAAGEVPDVKRQLRLKIETKQGAALLYSASNIEVLKTESLNQHPFLAKLGPDILSEQPSTQEIVDRISSKPFYRRQLASLLLDQTFLAGLGTYLCAEILFFTKLNPKAKPSSCTQAELKRLASNIINITQRSYRTEGVTNPPSLVKKLKAEGQLAKAQHRFSVYGRAGESCYHCGNEIHRFNIGSRPMYSCSSCQAMA